MGWNGSDGVTNVPHKGEKRRTVGGKRGGAQNSTSRHLATSRGIVAALVVVIGAGLAWWFYSRSASVAPEPKPTAPARKSPKPAPKKVLPKPKAVEKPKPKIDPKKAALREKVKNMTPEEKRQFAFEMMQNREIDLTPTTNRPFRTGIELSMARIFMTRVGDPPPPLHTTFIPIKDEAHLAEILIANNPVIEGDSDEVKDAKATVELVKKEMVAFIKEGGAAKDFLPYYYDKLRSAFEERRESLREVARVALQEPEIAQTFYEDVNKRLTEKGIRPIEFTDKQKAKLGLR